MVQILWVYKLDDSREVESKVLSVFKDKILSDRDVFRVIDTTDMIIFDKVYESYEEACYDIHSWGGTTMIIPTYQDKIIEDIVNYKEEDDYDEN